MSLALYLSGAASFGAGFVDSIVGGGGLIQLPALLILHPDLPFAEVSSVNKTASFAGTLLALMRYTQRVPLEKTRVAPGAVAAFCFAVLGSLSATVISTQVIKPLAIAVLILVALYTFVKKDLGTAGRSPKLPQVSELSKILVIAAAIGFYDGLFGPGTGSFFVFLLVVFFGLDFLKASVEAKALNLATNIAAILTFGAKGYFRPDLFLPLAACNVAGSYCGTWAAMRFGSVFVRKIFLCIVVTILLRLAADYF